MTSVAERLDFIEWLLTPEYPAGMGTVHEVSDWPGWFFRAFAPESTGGAYYALHVRHRDGRSFEFRLDLMRGDNAKHPYNRSFDFIVATELAERYP